jgi:O-methyltransferase involved in polyketide biosynthesis
MEDRQPSQTALAAAAACAAHLVVDREPLVFRDPVAADLIGEPGAEMVGYHRASGDHIVLSGTRAQVTVRSRYTEQRLAELAADGLTQYVLLGAGLDGFAYRSPLATRIRVFEVDHPATQRWKRDLLAAARITPPRRAGLRRGRPGDRAAGRPPGRWWVRPLGAGAGELAGGEHVPHPEAVAATLAEVGGLAAGTELVMEYALPPELRDQAGTAYAEFALQVAAERGEPWLSFFTPEQLSELLEGHGMKVTEQVRQRDAVPPALWRRSDALRPLDLCRLARAVVST